MVTKQPSPQPRNIPLTFPPRAITLESHPMINHEWHLKIISNSNEKPDQGNKVFRLFHFNLLPVSIIMIETELQKYFVPLQTEGAINKSSHQDDNIRCVPALT